MPINHSMYMWTDPRTENKMGESLARGIRMGDMIKNMGHKSEERKRVKDTRAKEQEYNRIVGEHTKADENGDLKTDIKTLSELKDFGPANVLKLQKAQGLEETRDLKRKAYNLDTRKKQAEISDLTGGFENSRKYKAVKMANEYKREDLNDKKLVKMEEKFVPGLGYAFNADDTKKLKSSKEMKNKFDRQIGELIGLRKEYGVEYFNREVVGRGKQLSKDLLLTYKNLAKLGVLSKSDEDIVNAIIPGDPLGQDWMPGQDATLHKLESFKKDLDEDYKETIKTRIQMPVNFKGMNTQEKINQYNPEQKAQRLQMLRAKRDAANRGQ